MFGLYWYIYGIFLDVVGGFWKFCDVMELLKVLEMFWGNFGRFGTFWEVLKWLGMLVDV